MTRNPIAVSWGGGVQSTYIAEAVMRGDLGPTPDLFVFADTGDEPDEVYEHVEFMFKRMRAHGLTCLEVRRENYPSLSEHTVGNASIGKRGISMPPMYVEAADGKPTPVRRGCTFDFKSKVLDKAVKRHFGVPRRKRGGTYNGPVIDQWLGISLDERQRMRESQDHWRRFVYPLVDGFIKRQDCIRYLTKHGIRAPRSACVYCPFHSNKEWRRIKAMPHEWAKAVEFERKVIAAFKEHGHVAGLRTVPYLHPQRVPLDQVNLGEAQGELFSGGFNNECAGICGV